MRNIVVFDIDGTLADASERLKFIDVDNRNTHDSPCPFCEAGPPGSISGIQTIHHLHSKNCPLYTKKDWGSFFNPELMAKDKCIWPMACVFAALSRMFQIVFCTGRPEQTRQATLKWLTCLQGYDPRRHPVYMRKDGDRRPDFEVKKDLLEDIGKDRIAMWFEDRKQVIDMLRKEGVFVLDVAGGQY